MLLVSAAVPMVVFGALGGVGTFSNMTRAFKSSGTALGVIAAGEGATAVLAVLTLVLTAFSQSTPAMVRTGLWAMPLAASVVGALTAPTWSLTAVQALTPMGMCVSAEGLALMVRRTMVYRTGIDPEQQRRTADTTRRLAYLRAVAAKHPDENRRRKAELEAWKVAGQAGAGDLVLGGELVDVQRERLTIAADDALSSMFTIVAAVPAAVAAAQVGAGGAPGAGALPQQPPAGSTLADVCAVAGITEPVPGDPMTADQVAAVLRWLRYSTNPPMSGRGAITAFRNDGYKATDAELWAAWRVVTGPSAP
ncbi:hypothetical protein OG455_41945 [Kitasatospora sp. NBC_01287]|uniref:hypothetical protein n=1 Tax=Kitasatospora sp. NBC_01287 TaxID=2903573 RepID=UPI002252062E|nr:hypothetical protein [Kitasatospora sp. NBC_01287]MCX4752008.1 hypothetical protein [Kitasatospora sp. NBC_01287]